VIDQQKFHDRLLGFNGLVSLGSDDHALCNRCCTRRHWLRCFFNSL
jgi:hypothetical protein